MLTKSELLSRIGDIGDTGDSLRNLEEQYESASGVVPFVGAGLSKQFGFPLWGEFLRDQARKAGGAEMEKKIQEQLDAGEYEEAAEELLGARGPRAFHDAIESTFGQHNLEGGELGGAVSLLPRIAAGPVITTNFDHVLEKVFEQANKPFARVVSGAKADASVRAFHRNQRLILKIHGDAEESTERILTREDYEKYYGSADASKLDFELPLPKRLRLMMMSRPLLFVGCSLNQDRLVAALYQVAREYRGIAHYAIVERPESDELYYERSRFLSNHGIRPIWYPHGEHGLAGLILQWLADMADSSDDGGVSSQQSLPANRREGTEDADRDRHDTRSSVRSSDISLGDHVQSSQRGRSMNDASGKVVFNFLHLTDLHFGVNDEGGLHYEVESEFFKDLKRMLIDENILEGGSLDLVLFTGDLVYSGRSEQFEGVNRVLGKLQTELEQMGYDKDKLPKLLAVPGNHDLTRPESTVDAPYPALDSLLYLWDAEEKGRKKKIAHVQRAFWENSNSPQRKVVNEAFKNYTRWWQAPPLPKPEIYYGNGLLPGDFSASVVKKGKKADVKLGIMGLNTTFLQIADGVHEGKLELNRSQFNRACRDGNGSAWAEAHNLCLLLTHHPPSWLTPDARKEHLYKSIHKPGRFALHLFGHMHEPEGTSLAMGGSEDRNHLQGCSLFGLADWKKGEDSQQRLYGYSVGQLEIDEDQLNIDEGEAKLREGKAKLRIWPRKAIDQQGDSWEILKDQSFRGVPDGKLATRPRDVTLNKPNGDILGPPEPPEDIVRDPKRSQVLANRAQDIDSQIEIDPILIARLDALQQNLLRDLIWVTADIKNVVMESKSPQELGSFGGQPWKKQLQYIQDLREALANYPGEMRNLHRDSASVLEDAWNQFAIINTHSKDVLGEYLDRGGLSIHRTTPNEKVSGMEDVANEFVRACARDYVEPEWLHFTVPERQEALNNAIARIIRLRFPEWTIWSLPLAAHELGHVVIEGNKDMVDFAAQEAKSRSWDEEHVYEILADAFATYMIGPAYVCAAISLRLDPLAISKGHVIDAERATAMFDVLRERNSPSLERGCSDETHESLITEIESLWQRWRDALWQAVPSKGQPETPTRQPERDSRDLVKAAWKELREALTWPTGQYLDEGRGLPSAKKWADDWYDQLDQADGGMQKLALPKGVSPKSTLRDALNAAWLCRIRRKPGEVDPIAETALELCEKIIETQKPTPVGGQGRSFTGDPPEQV